MANKLIVKAGQNSQAGIKAQNEDCCGIFIPEGLDLTHKGIVAITADGVGSSEAGAEASEYCVQGFITDYYSTPMSWSVQTSAERIIHALNSWLYSQGQRRYASELSLASTLAILIIKSTTAHLFHVGDSRIYLIRKGTIRQLTKDHRLTVDRNKTYLARAMGGEYEVNLDYKSLHVEVGDIFVLHTDGIHEFLDDEKIKQLALAQNDAELAAISIVEAALAAGSNDNVTCQIIRVEQLPNQDENEYYRQLTTLPFPPPLSAGMQLDGYRIIREIHTSVTVQVYLAEDLESGETVVLKTPSVNFEDDPAYIDRFMHEEWVGRRINNPHVFKVHNLKQHRSSLYYVTEFLEGSPLSQWMLDHPDMDLSEVRRIAEQIIKGLRGFHRKEMVHQDLKPENIMIDLDGNVKIIDFGCVQVSGLKEIYTPIQEQSIQGTANYIAPELFDGFEATPKSDMYSLGVTLYTMLSHGHYPYGELEKAQKHKHYDYVSIRQYNQQVPVWMDGALEKSVHPNPEKRYERFSEFLHDLCKPNQQLMKTHAPLIERNPIGFWRGLSIIMLCLNLFLVWFIIK
ncbi:MAG: bifunctional protein-serine/threonine kinase/phosphatase [Mariprofundaceae bacterium]|nr:bifunctional protein-serine/threonine kinase/phosphatase [Mariprofundaceae bacterium]